jgi:peptide/nickel transport system permease protein
MLGLIGLAIVAGSLIIALAAPWISPYDPLVQSISNRFQFPTASHIFGTDELGRDILSRVLWGSRLSLLAAFTTVASAITIGLLIGAIAGFFGSWADELLMRLTDMFLGFPSLVLAMAIAAGLGPSLQHAMIAMIVVWWPAYARVARGETLRVKQLQYVEAARATGENPLNVLFRYVVPNCLTPLIVMATLDVGGAILTAASLSFLGLGAQPPIPEWGSMINTGRVYIFDYWWIPTFPGVAILIAALGFNLLGDAVRDIFDPKTRRL